jgi:hypothetical protein
VRTFTVSSSRSIRRSNTSPEDSAKFGHDRVEPIRCRGSATGSNLEQFRDVFDIGQIAFTARAGQQAGSKAHPAQRGEHRRNPTCCEGVDHRPDPLEHRGFLGLAEMSDRVEFPRAEPADRSGLGGRQPGRSLHRPDEHLPLGRCGRGEHTGSTHGDCGNSDRSEILHDPCGSIVGPHEDSDIARSDLAFTVTMRQATGPQDVHHLSDEIASGAAMAFLGALLVVEESDLHRRTIQE